MRVVRILMIGAVLLIGVTPAHVLAAYTTSTVESRAERPDGLVEFKIVFTGDSGEPNITKSYVLVPASTPQESYRNLRLWVNSVINQLNQSRLAVNVAVLQPQQTIPALAPTPPVPPAKTAWREKVNSYDLICTKGFTGNVASECTALKSDIEATHQAGFVP